MQARPAWLRDGYGEDGAVTIDRLDQGGRWLLPDGVEEILPPRARQIEALRQRILQRFDLWGFELVFPPLLEFLDSLLVGVGGDLDLQTFKVTDQESGRLMGIRADLTSQAARIDAHSLRSEGPTRLCYAGTVLRTRGQGLFGSRSPVKVGAELYGVPGPEGDAEVLALMAETLAVAGLGTLHIELGHVAIYRALANAAGLPPAAQDTLFDAVQRKAAADIRALLHGQDVPADIAKMIITLPSLLGNASVLPRARQTFAAAPPAVTVALDELEKTAELARQRCPALDLGFDLSELHGYNYHTGTVFSAYAPDHGQALARGGRYDDIGQAFGRGRPATGFDLDLKVLVDLSPEMPPSVASVRLPTLQGLGESQIRSLWRRVNELREQGVRVLPQGADGWLATAELLWDGTAWVSTLGNEPGRDAPVED
ncbi:MAG: ATP phosphoribosyltransferase regulatory subunit [Gammaproteobacteria bacterium]|nr:MAG: ATP phosphoribosyltransferase regulatory subunit [Gammaproteobacteria bacterium]